MPEEGWLAKALKGVNLPKIFLGPAGEAVSRLIGGVADIPAAGLERISARIRSKTEGERKVSKAITEAVKGHVTADAELIERAANTLISKELRKQSNKEAIARKTIEHLQDDSKEEDAPQMPDEDWFNMFEQYAEQASSEKLQDMWARVLAGEIRRRHSFSLKTLRFVSELDQEVASTFEKWNSRVVADFIPKPTKMEGAELTEILLLEDFGLVTGGHGFLSKNVTISGGGITFPYPGKALHIVADTGTSIKIPALLLSRVGKEIASILPRVTTREDAMTLCNAIPKNKGVNRIVFGDHVGDSILNLEVLWERDQQEG